MLDLDHLVGQLAFQQASIMESEILKAAYHAIKHNGAKTGRILASCEIRTQPLSTAQEFWIGDTKMFTLDHDMKSGPAANTPQEARFTHNFTIHRHYEQPKDQPDA